jgi:hypothetical protein
MEGNYELSDKYKQVKELVKEGRWDEQTLIRLFKPDMVEHIKDKVRPPTAEGNDVPVWFLEAQGGFTVRSIWHYIRDKGQISDTYKCIWVKGFPFKIAFFMWRSWKSKILVDDNVRIWGLQGPSKY